MTVESWLDDLAQELAARGVDAERVAAIVVEAEGHLHDAADEPLTVFGSPARYAGEVAVALGDASSAAAVVPGPVRLGAAEVEKRYRRRRVLDGVSLDVRDGQVVLLIGANGSGKSTLLRVLVGLATPDAGRVRVAGSIGYAPQEGGILPSLRPWEHFILFGRSRGLGRAAAIAEGRRLAEQLGWDALAAPPAAALSGGTRQKLNVVLAALGAPAVLVLDEPYQGLDHDSTRRFWDFLWDWRDRGGAALVVSHARDALERADVVLELAGGRLDTAGAAA